MNLKPSVIVGGIEWKLFCIEFKSPDGTYSAYLYAIDFEHASYQVEAIGQGCEIFEVQEA